MMKLFKSIYPIFYYLLFISWCFASTQGTIKIIDSNNLLIGKANYIKEHQYYISVNSFSDVLLNKNFINNNTEKIVIYFGDTKIKITANTSFIIINDMLCFFIGIKNKCTPGIEKLTDFTFS